ncbi:MAG: DUF3618 domain-containing protein [Pseudonocardiaceae bacterium]
MSGSEQQRLQEAQLQEEIEELRAGLGETVEALVHKADLPARAKERGNELRQQTVERGTELLERGNKLSSDLRERGNEFKGDLLEWGDEFKGQVLARSSELRDRAVESAERARGAVGHIPKERWVKVACAGLALIAVIVIVRRVRHS